MFASPPPPSPRPALRHDFRTWLLIAVVALLLPNPLAAQQFIRGDVNGDGSVDLIDVTALTSAFYSAGPAPASADAADANDNGLPEISDIAYLLYFVVGGGPPPPPPFPAAGDDPTPDDIPLPVSDTITVTIHPTMGIPGEILEIPISMTNFDAVAALELAFGFDAAAITLLDWSFVGSVIALADVEYVSTGTSNLPIEPLGYLAAIADFATPMSSKTIPAGINQILTTLTVAIEADAARPQVSSIVFASGISTPPKYNIATLPGGTAVTPLLVDGLIDIRVPFIRGDVNRDTFADLSDSISIIEYLFVAGATPQCMEAADVNNDAGVDIADAIFLLNYFFVGGPAPSEPFPTAGADPDDDWLGCNQ